MNMEEQSQKGGPEQMCERLLRKHKVKTRTRDEVHHGKHRLDCPRIEPYIFGVVDYPVLKDHLICNVISMRTDS
jgi:hypothetical protein